MQKTQRAIAKKVALAPLLFRLEQAGDRIRVGTLCEGNCLSLESFQRINLFCETIDVISTLNASLKQVHQEWGFHGGISAQQIAVRYQT